MFAIFIFIILYKVIIFIYYYTVNCIELYVITCSYNPIYLNPLPSLKRLEVSCIEVTKHKKMNFIKSIQSYNIHCIH